MVVQELPPRGRRAIEEQHVEADAAHAAEHLSDHVRN
jgi:hypothetical protein